MKKALIVALVCVNVALLLALMLGSATPPARAQVMPGETDYMLVPGRIRSETAAIYILDLGKQSLGAFQYEKNAKKLLPVSLRPHSIKQDFRAAP